MQTSPTAHVDTFARDHRPPPERRPDLLLSLPELRYPPTLNCAAELLDATIARHGPDRTALLGEGPGYAISWTYGELRDQAARIARVLVDDLGVVPGNRVLLRGPNSPWLGACWLAIISAGAIVVPVVPVLRAAELRTIAGIAHVTHALCDERSLDDLVKAEIPGLSTTSFGVGTGPDDGGLQRLAAAKPPEFTPVATASDDVCMIAFTSGTTGRPKGCMHAHRDVLAIADTFSAHVLKPRPDDVFTGSPPLSFTYGLGGALVFPLRAGAASLLLARATPDALPAAIARHGVTVLFTAPTAYRAILANPGPPGAMTTLRRCVSAGEKLPRAVWDDWHTAFGVKIIDGIGSTEMLHIFIGSADDDIRPGSTGRPVPGYEARVVDDTGAEVPDGEPGRLAVRGPTGCHYLDDPRQADYVRDGWNLTGDTYVRDADGYFWYQARSDDMIISSGYNIAGPEVEEALMRHPDVAEVAVVGVPDAARGQIVAAFVVLRDPASASEDKKRELQDFAKGEIAPYKYPRAVEFAEALPRTPTGKLQRYRLRPG
ncbi:MAG TPA: AMP-binding protein [Streptosporangiaceae bacterium]|jgi:2-aminobenzoate-CoA ligase